MRTRAQQTKSTSAPAGQATHAARATTAHQKNLPLLLQDVTYARQPVHDAAYAENDGAPKLAVNRPGDRYEQEADRIAEAAVRMPDAVVQPKCTCDSGQAHRVSIARRRWRRRCSASPLSRHLQDAAGHRFPAPVAVPPSVERTLTAPGVLCRHQAAPDMEARLGHDFRATRIHDDAQARNSAREIPPRLHVRPAHRVRRRAISNWHHPEGRQLLAHELVHVIQQSGSQTADPRLACRRSPVRRHGAAKPGAGGLLGNVRRHGAGGRTGSDDRRSEARCARSQRRRCAGLPRNSVISSPATRTLSRATSRN